MKRSFLLILGFVSCVAIAFAQTTTEVKPAFTPSGKFDGRIFANYNYTVDGDVEKTGFEIRRAYLGYNYNFSSNWSSRVLLDIADDKTINRYVFFKNVALFYTKDKLKLGFGMQDNYSIKPAETLWGKRYIEKEFLDAEGFAHSADLGVSALYTLDKFVFDAAIYNGEGYQKSQKDTAFRAVAGVLGYFFDKKIMVRLADEVENKNEVRNTAMAFVGYNGKKLTGGVEYILLTNYEYKYGYDRQGLSIFANYSFTDKWAVFGRYDVLSTSDDYAPAKNDGPRYLGGIEYKAVKGVRGSLNLQGHEYDLDPKNDFLSLYFNVEVSF